MSSDAAQSDPTRSDPTRSDPIDALLEALRAEHDALVRGDTAALPEIVARKEAQVSRCAALGGRPVPADARASMAEKLRAAKDLNDTNAMLLAPRLGSVRARIALLGAATGRATYGTDGAARIGIGQRFALRA